MRTGRLVEAAEPPALGDRLHPDAVDGHGQHGGDVPPGGKGGLHGPLHQHRPVDLGDGHDHIRFEVAVFDQGDAIGPFQNEVGLGKPFFHVAFAQLVVGQKIPLLVDRRRPGRQGLAGIEDRGQGIVFHLDQREGFLSDRLALRGDEDHRIPHETHLVPAEDRLIVEVHPETVSSGNVFGGQDRGHPRQTLRLLHPDG
jgi:hypothetical protein